MQEEKSHEHAHFVTLTYDTRYVPISENGFMTLKPKDVQHYMKRLRKLVPGSQLKYYFVGEYGTKNKRPHYHAIIFGVPDEKLYADAWALGGIQFGTVHVGKVSSDSIAYTMKYIDKEGHRKQHGRDDRVPEFSYMSKGLGSGYLSPAMKQYHRNHMGTLYVTKQSGHRVPMPRYYRKKIWNEQEMRQQRYIVADAVAELEKLDRQDFDSRYAGQDYTYEQYVSSRRYGRHDRFYNSINSHNRKL